MDGQNESGGSDQMHTEERPYCDDPGCWCHTDASYHAAVVNPWPVVSPEQYQQALAFWNIQQ